MVKQSPSRSLPKTVAVAFAGLALLGAVVLITVFRGEDRSTLAYAAPGMADDVRLSAPDLVRDMHVVLPEVLGEVYAAFGLTGEGAIYDRLATVASGPALEALYLERAGSMASNGLPDQKVHELKMLGWQVRTGADSALIDATWRVLGEVGHAEHTHMRGNAYSAKLVMTPVDDAWRLTGFDLTEVDRTEAGTVGDTSAQPDASVPQG